MLRPASPIPPHGAPLPPPAPGEAVSAPEREPQLELSMGAESLSVFNRQDFRLLPPHEQRNLRHSRPDHLNDIHTGERGIYLGASKTGEAFDAEITTNAAGAMYTYLERNVNLDGATDDQALDAVREAADIADRVVGQRKLELINSGNGAPGTRWLHKEKYTGGKADVAAVHFFQGEDGKNKAVLFGAGKVSIYRIRGAELEGLEEEAAHLVGEPRMEYIDERLKNATETLVSPTGNDVGLSGDPSVRGATDQVMIVDVQPGDRFVAAHGVTTDLATPGAVSPDQTKPQKYHQGEIWEYRGDNFPVTALSIAKRIYAIDDPQKAAAAVTTLASHTHFQDFQQPEVWTPATMEHLSDVSVAVIDVGGPVAAPAPPAPDEPGRMRRLYNSAVGTAITAKGKIQSWRNSAVQNARQAYEADRGNLGKRLRYIGAMAGAAAVTGAGMLIASRMMGAEGLVAHGADDASAAVTPEAHAGQNAPDMHLVSMETSLGSEDTGGMGGGRPEAGDPFGPGGTLAEGFLPDPNNLPNGVELSAEQLAWLKAETGSGEIGQYSPGSVTNDGTGIPGTAWHTALSGLKDLGYDVSEMSRAERTAYVQHVLDLDANKLGDNKLTWDAATRLQDDHFIHNPSNAEAIKLVTEITGQDGKPLMPAEGSPAAEHLAEIRKQIETQIAGGQPEGQTPGQSGEGQQPGGSGEGTQESTPSAATSAPASSNPSAAPAPAPAPQTPGHADHTTPTATTAASSPEAATVSTPAAETDDDKEGAGFNALAGAATITALGVAAGGGYVSYSQLAQRRAIAGNQRNRTTQQTNNAAQAQRAAQAAQAAGEAARQPVGFSGAINPEDDDDEENKEKRQPAVKPDQIFNADGTPVRPPRRTLDWLD